MVQAVNITTFRKNIFEYARLIEKGYVIEVEKGGAKVFKAVKVVDDWATKAGELHEYLKDLGGKYPDWKYSREEFRDTMVEKEYLKRIDKLWK